MADTIKIINAKVLADGNVLMDTTKLGMQNEKNVTKLVFDIPAELDNYNKTIEFDCGNNKVTDIITNNEYIIDNNISCNLFISFQVVFTDAEGHEVFKTFLNECIFQPSINAVSPAPTPEQVSEWNALVTELNQKMQEVEDLRDEIGGISEELDPTVPQYIKEIKQEDIENWNNKSEFSGDYNDLKNKPNIPTKTSQLENDKGYMTSIPSEYVTESELTKKGYATEKYVTDKIEEAQLNGGEVDLTGLATKEELANYVKETELESKVKAIGNGYYATEEYVTNLIGDIEKELGGI